MAQQVELSGPVDALICGILFDSDGTAVVSADEWVAVHVQAEAEGIEVVAVTGKTEGVGDMILDLSEMFAH